MITETNVIDAARQNIAENGFDFEIRKVNAYASEAQPITLFDADMNPVQALPTASPAKGFCAITEGQDVWHFAKSRYTPLQPRDLYESILRSLECYQEESGQSIHSISGRRIGAKLFVDACLGKFEVDRADRKKGDVLDFGLRFSDSFDGTSSFSLIVYTKRLVCLNGATHTKAELSAKHRHTISINQAVEQTLSLIHKRVADLPQIQEIYGKLALKEINEGERLHLVNAVLGIKDETDTHTRTLNTRDQILNLAINGRGNSGSTLFDVFNGFTEYETHERGTRGSDNPEASRFLISNGFSGRSLGAKAFKVMEQALTVGAFSIAI